MLYRRIKEVLALILSLFLILEILCCLFPIHHLFKASHPNYLFVDYEAFIRPHRVESEHHLYTPDPERVYALKPNHSLIAKNFISDELYSVSTDSMGFRSHQTEPFATKKILFLGDSITFGLLVENNETFASHVQRLLNGSKNLSGRTQTFNAGVPGYCSLLGSIYLKQLLSSHSFNTLVLGFGMNDHFLHERTRADSLQKLNRWKTILEPLQYLETLNTIYRIQLGRKVKTYSSQQIGVEAVPPDQFRENMTSMIQLGLSTRAKIILLDTFSFISADGYSKILMDLSERFRVPLIQFRDVFSKAGISSLEGVDPDYHKFMWEIIHPNAEGHLIIAREIAAILRHSDRKFSGHS